MHIRWIILVGLLASLAVSSARAAGDGLVTRPSKYSVAETVDHLQAACGRPEPPCLRASITRNGHVTAGLSSILWC
jgi:hypothetical protein